MKRKAQIIRAKNQEKIKTVGGKNSEEIMKASQKARDQRQRAGVRKTREKPDSQSLAKSLALAIARLFPESFTVFGERIAVRNDAGTEATRAMVRADLEALEEKR